MTTQIANFFKSCLKAVFLTVCFFTVFLNLQTQAIAAIPGTGVTTAPPKPVCGGRGSNCASSSDYKPDPNIVTTPNLNPGGRGTNGTTTTNKTTGETKTTTSDGTKIDTTKNADGSETTVRTNPDGTKDTKTTFPSLPTDAKNLKFGTAKDTPGGGFSECPTLDQIRAKGLSANGLLEKCGQQLITFMAVIAIFGLVLRVSLIGFAMFAPGGKDETAKIKGLISDVVIGILLLGGFGMFITIINPAVFQINGVSDIAKFAANTSGGGATGGGAGGGTTGTGGTGDQAPTPIYKGNGTYSKDTIQNAIATTKDPKATAEEKTKAAAELKDLATKKAECEKGVITTAQYNLCNEITSLPSETVLEGISLSEPVFLSDSDPIINTGNVAFNMRKMLVTQARTRANFSANTSTNPSILPKQNWELDIQFEPKLAGEYVKTARLYVEDCQDTLIGGKGLAGQLDTTVTSLNGSTVTARYYNPRVMIGQVFGPEAMTGLSNSTVCKTQLVNEQTTDIRIVDWQK